MGQFRKLKIAGLEGYKIDNKGRVKTPKGSIRLPFNIQVEGIYIRVQKFPELSGFGNINIKYL